MRQSPLPSPPQCLEIGYSTFVLLVASALYLLALGNCAFWLLGLVSGHPLGILVGLGAIAGVLLLLMFLPTFALAWTHRGPVVRLDSDGVTDLRKRTPHIPWSDIARVQLGTGQHAATLCFSFRRPDSQRQDTPLPGPLGTLLSRFRGLGDWNVSLRLLACRRMEVLRSAEALRRAHIRRCIEAADRQRVAADDPQRGWSGQL